MKPLDPWNEGYRLGYKHGQQDAVDEERNEDENKFGGWARYEDDFDGRNDDAADDDEGWDSE